MRTCGTVHSSLVLLFVEAGCATSYVPRSTSALRITMEGGSTQFVRNGAVVQKGSLGTGLIEAMKDVPQAQQHARSYRSMNIAGLLLYGVGLIDLAVGAVVWPFSKDYRLPAGLVGAGAGLSLIGLGVMSGSSPYLFDAINVYNDAQSTDASPMKHEMKANSFAAESPSPTKCITACGQERKSCVEDCGRSEKCRDSCVGGYTTCVKTCSP